MRLRNWNEPPFSNLLDNALAILDNSFFMSQLSQAKVPSPFSPSCWLNSFPERNNDVSPLMASSVQS
jgi:hypothetical protein